VFVLHNPSLLGAKQDVKEKITLSVERASKFGVSLDWVHGCWLRELRFLGFTAVCGFIGENDGESFIAAECDCTIGPAKG
jgi:hypothetical protein